MLRIEIDALIGKLGDKDLKERKEAKNILYELEKNGNIQFEILVEYLNKAEDILGQIYAISAICRNQQADKQSDKKKILEEFLTKTNEPLLLTNLLKDLQAKKLDSFEKCIVEKYYQLNQKDKDILSGYTLGMLHYLKDFGSKKSHKLLFNLLESKDKRIKFYSLYALLKTKADIPNQLLEKLKKTSGSTKHLAESILVGKMKKEQKKK